MLVYELIWEDIVLRLEARVNGECISGGDAVKHGGSGDLGERGEGEGEPSLCFRS